MTDNDICESLLRITRDGFNAATARGEAQQAELELAQRELAELRHQRDILARRLAELAHKHLNVTYVSAA